jgi:hypothetical protein
MGDMVGYAMRRVPRERPSTDQRKFLETLRDLGPKDNAQTAAIRKLPGSPNRQWGRRARPFFCRKRMPPCKIRTPEIMSWRAARCPSSVLISIFGGAIVK